MSREAPKLLSVRASAAAWNGGAPLARRLDETLGVVVRGALAPDVAEDWTRRIYRARRTWIDDFGGEQFSLGRAFYTHYETDRARLYFRDAQQSDARVERHVPGLQAVARATFARATGGAVQPRPGFSGAGVHIFPTGEKVARSGGVVHFDTEGIAPVHLARRARAVTIVIMLQPPAWGGGLRIHDASWSGHEHPSERERASPHRTVRYGAGDLLVMSSYQLHQIRPFRGELDRVSLTLHGVEVDRDHWEVWF